MSFRGEEDGLKEDDFGQHRLGVTTTTELNVDPTDIQRFYCGASILVTGATGFMGKVLIEKLLRSCPDVDRVYMMVREKKGRSLDERIDDLVSSPCFDLLKQTHPEFRSKLRVVSGDIGAAGLALSDHDRHLLEQQINIVFHVAATVRFDEHLKLSILQNVRGTREVLNLCKTLRNIKAVLHVSTAYSNCPNTHIEERFYEPHLPSDQAIHMAETLDVTTIDHLSHKLMGEWPNTYAFTKALSEDVVKNHGQGLPVGVFRPSIVVGTYKEPSAGWVDNVYGPNGVIVASSSGLLRVMQVNGEAEANQVPCDMAICGLIASARDVAENRSVGEMPVYNYVLPRSNSFTWNRLQVILNKIGSEYPPSRALWHPAMIYAKNDAVYFLLRFLVHFLPALIMDICFMATGRSARMVRVYRKIHKFTGVISYFTTQEWVFENKNTVAMWNGLKESDKKLFYFDMDSLDWYRFFMATCQGMRLHLLKDPVETLAAAKIKYKRLKVLHHAMRCVVGIFVIWILIQILPLIGAALHAALEHTVFSWFVPGKNILLKEVAMY